MRTAHGRARELGAMVAVEVAVSDELPSGVAAPDSAPDPRGPGGRYAPGPGASERAYRASQAPRIRDPRSAWVRAQCRNLAASVGGGVCGPAVVALVRQAELADHASRALYATDIPAALRAAAQSRQSLLAAHELCAREAEGRECRRDPSPPTRNPNHEERP